MADPYQESRLPMPIKFRCNYCRQFLGISRAQAGGVVDCPTCGRSIRVPLLDGTVKPLPNPELNLQDAHLAKALDELAHLGELLDESDNDAEANRPGIVSVDDDDFDDGNEIPQPIPEPIPLEVPIAPTPVKLPAPTFESDLADDVDPSRPESIPPQNGLPGIPSAESKNAAQQRILLDESLLAELASLAPSPKDAQRLGLEIPSESRSLSPARASNSTGSITSRALVIVGVFVAGMFVERFARFIESFQTRAKSGKESALQENPVATELTGRITFKSPEGESKPDRGARLIVLPGERVGTVKLPTNGFRPGDDEADTKVAMASIQSLGGALVVVSEEGRFQLPLQAGSYRVLVLSHFQPAKDDEAPDETVLKQLGEFFQKPPEVLGRLKHHFAPLRVKGTGETWDHVF